MINENIEMDDLEQIGSRIRSRSMSLSVDNTTNRVQLVDIQPVIESQQVIQVQDEENPMEK